jgi:hypothetical protein
MTEDLKMKQVEQEVAVAREFLTGQIKKEKRSMKIRLVVGVLLSVIVFGYMFWLSNMLAKMGSPEYIRDTIVTVIKDKSPEMLAAAKREILSHKHDIIDFLTKEGVDNIVHMLMSEGQKSLEKMIARITNETIGELNQQFSAVMAKEDSRLRVLLADLEQENLEEKIVKAFDDDLQQQMGQLNLDEDFREPLGRKHKEALEHLRKIHRSLESLASKDSLSRKETLMLRFIKSWAGYVQQVGDEEPVGPQCDDGAAPAGLEKPKCADGTISAFQKGAYVCVHPGTCQPQ